MGMIETPAMHNWNVTICGEVGSEIIVTTNQTEIYAHRGSVDQRWQYTKRSSCGIPVIGCETHLVVAFDGKIQLYRVNGEDSSSTELLSLCSSIEVEEGESDADGFINESVAWGPGNSHFIVGYPHQISVWKLDATTDSVSLTKTITVVEFEVKNVALAEDYIVVSSENKKVHVWNRGTGEKMAYHTTFFRGNTLCDIGLVGDDELTEDDLFTPFRFPVMDQS